MNDRTARKKYHYANPDISSQTYDTAEANLFKAVLNTYSIDIASCKYVLNKRKRLRKELKDATNPKHIKLLKHSLQYVWSGWVQPTQNLCDLLMQMTSDRTGEMCEMVGGSHRAFLIQRAVDLRQHLGLNLFSASSLVGEDLTARDVVTLHDRLNTLGLGTYDIDLIDAQVSQRNKQKSQS